MLAPAVQIDNHIYGYVQKQDIKQVIDMFLSEFQNESKKYEVCNYNKAEVRICLCSSCSASGSNKIYNELTRCIKKFGYPVNLKIVSCMGISYKTPLIQIIDEKSFFYHYGNVSINSIESILHYHFKPKKIVNKIRSRFSNFVSAIYEKKDIDENRFGLNDNYFLQQEHITTELCGETSPIDIDEYKKNKGFLALRHVLKQNRNTIIEELKKSGLRGRGGAGFFTGEKWELTKKAVAGKKYVICNADEGDPGAFMDRSVLEGDPFLLIEGMLIASYAIGADEGYIYCRAEYPLALKRINKAIMQLEKQSLLGKNICGKKHSFFLHVKEGAGAFVCGEETALMHSIEGKRGMPRLRPPFPAESGIFGCPSNINNV